MNLSERHFSLTSFRSSPTWAVFFLFLFLHAIACCAQTDTVQDSSGAGTALRPQNLPAASATPFPPSAKKDSLPPPSSAGRPRRSQFSFQAGAAFLDFSGKDRFKDDLQAYISEKYQREQALAAAALARDSTTRSIPVRSRILQPYDPVTIAFPIGLAAAFPVSRHFDAVANIQWLLREQEAIIEDRAPDILKTPPAAPDTISGAIANISRKFGLQAGLLGLGFRFYIPLELMSIERDKEIFISCIRFWNFFSNELYSSSGSVPASQPVLQGTGFEVSAGYRLAQWKSIAVSGSIGISSFHFSSSETWNRILLQNIDEPVEWNITGLVFNFQAVYQLGGFPDAAPAAGIQNRPPPDSPFPVFR